MLGPSFIVDVELRVGDEGIVGRVPDGIGGRVGEIEFVSHLSDEPCIYLSQLVIKKILNAWAECRVAVHALLAVLRKCHLAQESLQLVSNSAHFLRRALD